MQDELYALRCAAFHETEWNNTLLPTENPAVAGIGSHPATENTQNVQSAFVSPHNPFHLLPDPCERSYNTPSGRRNALMRRHSLCVFAPVAPWLAPRHSPAATAPLPFRLPLRIHSLCPAPMLFQAFGSQRGGYSPL